MAVHLPQQGMKRMWSLGPDIIEECKEVDLIDNIDIEQWKPLFEPGDFNGNQCYNLRLKYILDQHSLNSVE